MGAPFAALPRWAPDEAPKREAKRKPRPLVAEGECCGCGGDVEMTENLGYFDFPSGPAEVPLCCITCDEPTCGNCLDGNGECPGCAARILEAGQ